MTRSVILELFLAANVNSREHAIGLPRTRSACVSMDNKTPDIRYVFLFTMAVDVTLIWRRENGFNNGNVHGADVHGVLLLRAGERTVFQAAS